jgi:hypothetical protein
MIPSCLFPPCYSPSPGMGRHQVLRINSGSLAVFAAIRRASAAYRRPSLSVGSNDV